MIRLIILVISSLWLGFGVGYVMAIKEIRDKIERLDWYHVHNGKLVHGSRSDLESLYKALDIYGVFGKRKKNHDSNKRT